MTARPKHRLAAVLLATCPVALPTLANPPLAKYIFPAGGQRGTTVNARVGGCFFHGDANFDMTGPGLEASPRIHEIDTTWFEGPRIPQPASQQAEDYPRDHAASIKVAADADLGPRAWRVWTAQGATAAMKFVVGDLPEAVEREIDGAPVPVEVKLPVTANGRIFPREDVDVWTFQCKAGQHVTCDVDARRLGSPLDAELKILDPVGKPVHARVLRVDGDPRVHFTAATDGLYAVRIYDIANGGLQHYVYRLTITADPYVDFVYPLGGRRGSKVRFELGGHGLRSGSAEVALPTDGATATVQFDQGGTKTNPLSIDLDDLPELLESEPNDEPSLVKPVTAPAVLNGRIGRPGDVDCWPIAMKKDQSFDLDLRAARLGSPLDSVLTVADAAGKQVARSDDAAAGQTDSQLTFKAPADGVYSIRVQDRFASRGGPAFAYRLRVAPPKSQPDFRLTLAADAIAVLRSAEPSGATTPKKPAPPAAPGLKVDVQRLGNFDGPITLTIDGLPPGVTATGTTVAAKQSSAEIKFAAAPAAKIAAAHLRVRGVADVAGKRIEHDAGPAATRARPPVSDVLLAVTIPTPFKATGEFETRYAPCGTIYRRRYALDRGGFDAPVTVRLADQQARHLQGVTGPTVVVPPGADSFEYQVSLPPDLELGRTSRSCIMLTGVVTDHDGSRHVVSFSSTAQNDQYIAIATATALGVRLDQTSLLASPGTTVALPFHVQRGRTLAGQPVKVELSVPPHFKDVRADPLALGAGESDGVLQIHFGPNPGPFTLPGTVRVTTTGPGDPTQADVPIELVPPDDAAR